MIREKLKIARVSKLMTQEQVAEKIGIKQSWYSKIENGTVNPSLDQAKLLMELLKVKVSVF